MVSLFNALNISTNALTVNESAISVVSHNVANMNTEGYSKQKVNLATRNIAGAIGDSTEAQVRANVITVRGKPVAGDIMTVSIDGFMHSLLYPESK